MGCSTCLLLGKYYYFCFSGSRYPLLLLLLPWLTTTATTTAYYCTIPILNTIFPSSKWIMQEIISVLTPQNFLDFCHFGSLGRGGGAECVIRSDFFLKTSTAGRRAVVCDEKQVKTTWGYVLSIDITYEIPNESFLLMKLRDNPFKFLANVQIYQMPPIISVFSPPRKSNVYVFLYDVVLNASWRVVLGKPLTWLVGESSRKIPPYLAE